MTVVQSKLVVSLPGVTVSWIIVSLGFFAFHLLSNIIDKSTNKELYFVSRKDGTYMDQRMINFLYWTKSIMYEEVRGSVSLNILIINWRRLGRNHNNNENAYRWETHETSSDKWRILLYSSVNKSFIYCDLCEPRHNTYNDKYALNWWYANNMEFQKRHLSH